MTCAVEDVESIKSLLFPNCLVHIDANVDLERMLLCKHIGQSMSMLCPNLPGLPSSGESQMYFYAKGMNADEKAKMLRNRNRVTSTKTRKRKKIYNHFLDCAIVQLSEILHRRQSMITSHLQGHANVNEHSSDVCSSSSGNSSLDATGNGGSSPDQLHIDPKGRPCSSMSIPI